MLKGDGTSRFCQNERWGYIVAVATRNDDFGAILDDENFEDADGCVARRTGYAR